MNGSITNLLSAAWLGVLALGFPASSGLAGEPIIMGQQTVSPDPGQRPRLDERTGKEGVFAGRSNPFGDDSAMRMVFVPPPVAAPSRRSQNSRDEKQNWMMLNRGDLTESARSDEFFGNGLGDLGRNPGRRDYFFEKPEGRAGLNGRQTLPGSALDLFSRSGLAMGNQPLSSSSQDDDGRRRRADDSRDSGGTASGAADGRKSIEEPGLGPLMNPGRLSGAQGFERWSASINRSLQRRTIDGVNDSKARREQYLDYLGSAQYSGASYPANTEWGKYQREWAGSAADARAATSAGGLGGKISGPSITKPATPVASSPTVANRSAASQGNLSGMGSLPSYLQQRGTPAPSRTPRVDYSLPKDPGSSFNFR